MDDIEMFVPFNSISVTSRRSHDDVKGCIRLNYVAFAVREAHIFL